MTTIATSQRTNATAAIVVIGSELVVGDLADTNGSMIAQVLLAHGVTTESIHIVRDDVEAVANLVRYLMNRVTHVITVGGLGPTIDDVTMEAVASAVGASLFEETPSDVCDYSLMSGSETKNSRLRRVPAGAEIIDSGHGPVVHIANIFSLPGMPRLVSARLPAILERLSGQSIVRVILRLPVRQSRIVNLLEAAAKRHPSVTIGCYPYQAPDEGIRLVFEGPSAEEIGVCRRYVEEEVQKLGVPNG